MQNLSPNSAGVLQSLSPFPNPFLQEPHSALRNIFVLQTPHESFRNNTLVHSEHQFISQDMGSLEAFLVDSSQTQISQLWKQATPLNLNQKWGLKLLTYQKALFLCYHSGHLFCQMDPPVLKNDNIKHTSKEMYLTTTEVSVKAHKIDDLEITPISATRFEPHPVGKLALAGLYAQSFLDSLYECQKQKFSHCIFGSSYLSGLGSGEESSSASSVFLASNNNRHLKWGPIFSRSLYINKNQDPTLRQIEIANAYFRAITQCYSSGYGLCSVSKLQRKTKGAHPFERVEVFVQALNISLSGKSSRGNFLREQI